MPIETIDFVLPVYWASYLINGDDSGISEKERAEIDSFVAGVEVDGCLDVSEESYFSWWNDATGLGGDVATFTFVVRN